MKFRNHRVFILPTNMGGYLIGLIFLMFLLSVGYGNNLLLIFTLLLFGLNMLWVVQSHFHLKRLKLGGVFLSDGHAGENLSCVLRWISSPEGVASWKVSLENSEGLVPLEVFQSDSQKTVGEFKLTQRGRWKWTHVRLSSDRPFGLYQTWIYFPVDVTSFTYPRLVPVELPSLVESEREGEHASDKPGPHEFRELAPYQAGQEATKISWKHYARSGEIFVKNGFEHHEARAEFCYRDPVSDKEFYLERLASELVACEREGVPFVFQGLGIRSGRLKECLEALSLC